jgi:transcriptional regulator with XRE-family HTH domain
MKQPELGKKIVDLRKGKGLTQEELASKCNITARTLQRIESGVGSPRSYTIKTIFSALDYNIYDFSESDSGKRVLTFFQNKTEQFYTSVLDLFNLKTNTMKKISILSAATVLIGLCLFFICFESNAQKTYSDKFFESMGRGIIYLFPKGSKIYISNVKDTADYHIGKNLVQEYKKNIFLDSRFIGKVLEGDTVVLDKGEIKILKSYDNFTSSTGKGIIYLLSKDNPMTNLSVSRDTEYLFLKGFQIKEFENKIFLNDKFIGTANPGDTVFFYNGIIRIFSRK